MEKNPASPDTALLVMDPCGDADEEVHRVLMGKVFPRQADVMTVDAWSAA